MRRALPFALPVAAAAISLAFAPAAFGAYSPSLTVTRDVDLATGDTTVAIGYEQTIEDAPPARVQITSPDRITATLTQSPGTALGTVDGSFAAGAPAGPIVPLTGRIVVGDPGNMQWQAAALACTGVARHDAIWLLEPTAVGQPFAGPVPIFVDLVPVLYEGEPTSDPDRVSVELCLPPPAALFQAKVLELVLHVSRFFDLVKFPLTPFWTAVNTPYDDAGTIDPQGTIETQAVDEAPVWGSFSVRRRRKTRKVEHRTHTDVFYSYFARIGGRLGAGPDLEPQATVDVLVGKRKVATVGAWPASPYVASFSTRLRLPRTRTYHAVYTKTAEVLRGASCTPALPLGAGVMPCGTVMSNGFTVTTGRKRLVRPRLTHRRVKRKQTG